MTKTRIGTGRTSCAKWRTALNGLVLILALIGAVMAAPMPKYKVTVKADKHVDFRTLRTYTWTAGWSAFNRTLDRRIVEAVDRELVGLGLVRRDAEPVDVLVRYGSLRRTDVDLDGKGVGKPKVYPEYPVATLVIMLIQPHTTREFFRTRIDIPVTTDISELEPQIDAIVQRMFARYPTRDSKD